MYMGMKNDVSCLIDSYLSLYEHQSTLNPNMPLRGLMYFGKMYSRYITENDLSIYPNNQVKVPTPQYYVFFNGDAEAPDRKVFYLSDAFEAPVRDGKYEWTATMLNINCGHNHELMKKCKILREYSVFVDRVKTGIKENHDLFVAIENAVNSCIADGILAYFLKSHKSEVIEMCITEYNEQETLNILEREARKEGFKAGRKEGLELVARQMREEGYPLSEIAKLTKLEPKEISLL